VWKNKKGKYVLFYLKDIAYSFAFEKKIILKHTIQYKRKENGE
jgi:hypothetical protein